TAPMALDQVNSDRVLVGTVAIVNNNVVPVLWESLDAWTPLQADKPPLGPGLNPSFRPLTTPITVSSLALAGYQGVFQPDPGFANVTDQGPNTYDPDTIYITNGSSIFVTKDHTQTWVNRTGPLAGLGAIKRLFVDPTDRDRVFAVRSTFGASGKVWLSND